MSSCLSGKPLSYLFYLLLLLAPHTSAATEDVLYFLDFEAFADQFVSESGIAEGAVIAIMPVSSTVADSAINTIDYRNLVKTISKALKQRLPDEMAPRILGVGELASVAKFGSFLKSSGAV